MGYRHIDTAQIYGNEADVGKAVRDSGIPRGEIFITTKLWLTNGGASKTRMAVQESIRKLQTHIDLILLHAPGNAILRAETWAALESLYNEGIVNNIGVSNFGIPHLEKLKKTAKVMPSVNQIELHPWLQRTDLVTYCKDNGIVVQVLYTVYSVFVLNR